MQALGSTCPRCSTNTSPAGSRRTIRAKGDNVLNLKTIVRRLGSVGLGILFAFQAGQVMAACVQTDVAGSWQVYMMDVDYRPGQRPSWTRCTLVVKPNGVFENTSSSCASSDGAVANVFGLFRLIGTQQCIFNGYVNGNGARGEFTRATMNRTKDHVDGVGTYPGGILFFNMTKP